VRLESSDFSLEPDRALGAALRATLNRPGDAEFTATVLARARAAGVGSSRAVLGRWTRLAMAVAAVAAVLAGVLAGTGREAATSFDAEWVTGLTGSATAGALFTAPGAPDATILFASTADN
jgi:hypothetical protein